MNHHLKIADLFSGIGGFRIAFGKAGYQCVYSCEKDLDCQLVYFNNFGEYPECDITQVNLDKLPNFDVLTAGFPCQPFSISGKRQGFEDTRGTLFFNICKIIEVKKPEVVLLENVKHLLHLDKGRTLEIILYSLEDLGYSVQHKLLNAKDFGLPQNRERVVIIGTKNKPFNFSKLRMVYPVPKLRDYLDNQGDFEYLNPEEYTLIDSSKKQTSGLIFVGYRNKSIWKKGIRPNTEHLSRVHHQPNRIYSIDGVHPTIPSQETSGRFFIYIPEENRVRKLTLTECYRIMGFPDNFKRHRNGGESYKQIGNSICIPLFQEIATQIKEQIFDIKDNQSLSEFNKKPTFQHPIKLEFPGLYLYEHQS